MKEKIDSLIAEISSKYENIKSMQELNDLKVEYLGKKGIITELNSGIKDVPNEEKKEYGMEVNRLRTFFNEKYAEIAEKLEKERINKKLEEETIDITLPSTKNMRGSKHPFNRIIEEVEDLFVSMGYDVIDGPELEDDEHCFRLLNYTIGHPARDAQDTFYIDEEYLLRTQTSSTQSRVMAGNLEKTPIRVICPGKTYRRDDDDATHSHQFMQIEGLLVDKDISLSDLKGTFDVVLKKIFGENVEIRFRPSYYQFTEPSVETDISCFVCNGKGCSLCKNTGWITVSGAGIVHPNVLRNCGYDPKIWSGFAFGFGAERLAMLKYGINDIRVFYQTDLRDSKHFDRKEV